VRDAYDVVVIGSGFGGAIMACRLAQAGHSVAVLERGRRWRRDEFPRAIGQVAEAFWREGRSHGFLEYLAFREVDVIQGAGVGGGSLHYFNVNVRTPAEIFERPAWPQAITRAALEPYYDLAQAMLESRPLRPPVGHGELPPRVTAFLEAARTAGYPVEQVPVAVLTDSERRHPAAASPQAPCTYCGNCLFGCHLHAKNTLDLNYLALAERRHRAEIFPLHAADSIVPRSDGTYQVEFRRLEGDPAGPARHGHVQARKVVVAAGALGSTRLLLSCRDRARTLPRLSRAVGERFSVNGEFLLAGALGTNRRVDAGLGPPIAAKLTVPKGDLLITVEDLGLPDALFWFLEGAMPPRSGRLRRLLALAAAYLQRSLGLGSSASRVSLEIDALVAGGRTAHYMPYLGMGTDTADGRIRLAGDGLDIAWSPRRNRHLYREMERVMTRLSEAAGGRFVTSFLWRWPLRKILTAHPLGGCPMGEHPHTAVVNDRGEVWGHPNLYVVDGSIVPAALAVNPSLTIGALAERAAFWINNGREMRAGDPAAPANT
jgi:cholesterol oxidase